MTNASQSIAVVAGIIWHNGRYLAAQRPEGKAHAGRWEFPGGKVEEGESREQALCRELKEELQIDIHEYSYFQCVEHNYPHGRVQLYFFHVQRFSGEPQACEGQTLRWIYPHEGTSLPFLEADKELVRALEGYTFF